MSYKGKYKPSYPKKYKGDPTNIVYRSLWERKFMVYCDNNLNVLEWQSEEFFIPYRSPVDNKIHRYFPDFFIKYKDTDGKIRSSLIEIKPLRQCSPPSKPKRQTKNILVRHMNMPKIKQSGKQRKNFVEIEDGNLK